MYCDVNYLKLSNDSLLNSSNTRGGRQKFKYFSFQLIISSNKLERSWRLKKFDRVNSGVFLFKMGEDDQIDIDTMLWHAGDFGRYQFILMFLFSVINFLSGFHYFGQTFISVVPEHKCRISEDKQFVVVNQCSQTVLLNDTYYETPCTEGWSYNNSYGYVSIVEEVRLFYLITKALDFFHF